MREHSHTTVLSTTHVTMPQSHLAIHGCFGSSQNLWPHLRAMNITWMEVEARQLITTHSYMCLDMGLATKWLVTLSCHYLVNQ